MPQDSSKTVIKKEMIALQDMGEKIVALPDTQLKKLPLDDKLLDAVLLARKITKHGGLKRQLQYIGKLMRHVDPEPIKSALDDIENGYQKETALFHKKEIWRDKLLSADAHLITEFLELYPATDTQQLRQLLRNYKNAKTDEKKKNISRIIFKVISEQII